MLPPSLTCGVSVRALVPAAPSSMAVIAAASALAAAARALAPAGARQSARAQPRIATRKTDNLRAVARPGGW